jgi:hypothetical protein
MSDAASIHLESQEQEQGEVVNNPQGELQYTIIHITSFTHTASLIFYSISY